MASLVKPWINRYRDADGKIVPRDTPGARKVKERSERWYGQVKDANGKWKRVPLFTDKTASLAELGKLVTAIERGEAGMVDPFKESKERPATEHMEEYLNDLRAKGVNAKHFAERERLLKTVLTACDVSTLADLTADKLDQFLSGLTCSARTRDTYRGAANAFGNWLVEKKRLPENPVAATTKPKGEVKRKRRAESVENLNRLLQIARERPLLEVLTVRKGKRKGERYAEVNGEAREKRIRLGRERALIYKTAILTGLRQDELRRLQVNHLSLEGDVPHLRLIGGHARKQKKDTVLPLLPRHAEELKKWVMETGKTATDKVFNVPEKPNKILRRDLKMAQIPYKDAEGRYFDFHSFRHCTDTYLNAAGVAPSVIMLFMRHRRVDLSMTTYNDPRMHNLRDGLKALPNLD